MRKVEISTLLVSIQSVTAAKNEIQGSRQSSRDGALGRILVSPVDWRCPSVERGALSQKNDPAYEEAAWVVSIAGTGIEGTKCVGEISSTRWPLLEGLRNFDPSSDDEDDIGTGIPSQTSRRTIVKTFGADGLSCTRPASTAVL
ncbi:hypothetical protein AVEN_63416-1 [Araneus ventricosus]|uniref:Uncharacterized protein n=1 Tax=Araneus ventricosus TaxID=182803 RepID=A0A4Y2K648_ARAVE|nr:hypothetical protein AVEN_63416-1 [Araneus ventricosus]